MAEKQWTPRPGNSGAVLKGFIERIERLTEEKKDIARDTRDVYAEAKGNGFDPQIMRIILKRRAMDKAEREEQDTLVATYARSLGEPVPDDDDETTSSSD
jgi:uncharacterized protein (UPF0335 family)